jgi:indolepyruvate ferredoxin oxidoreductase
VTVEGGALALGPGPAKLPGEGAVFPVLPEPAIAPLARPWSILVTGIGGTGVVTIGQIIGMAAHLEGKGAGIIDMAGLAQKNGAVVTHLKLAERPADIAAIRVAAGGADLVLGCDLVTTASERILASAARERTHAVVNTHEVMPAQFTRDADFRLPGEQMRVAIAARVRPDGAHFLDTTAIATALLGDSIAANMLTLGVAWQNGLVPVSAEAIEKAIELNGVAVKMNTLAFRWGRRAAHDPQAVEAVIGQAKGRAEPAPETLEEVVARRVAFLADYQNAGYAAEYSRFVETVRAAEAAKARGSTALAHAVARYLFKLMAYKDEYEVARLYTDGSFERALREKFAGDFRLKFHLAPPLLARRDPETGHLRKRTFGPWMMSAFSVLARLRGLRGTPFDIFGYSRERRTERRLIASYRAVVEELLGKLSPANLALAVEIASIPEHIRGYGHVKERHLADAKAREAELLSAFRAGKAALPQAIAAE